MFANCSKEHKYIINGCIIWVLWYQIINSLLLLGS